MKVYKFREVWEHSCGSWEYVDLIDSCHSTPESYFSTYRASYKHDKNFKDFEWVKVAMKDVPLGWLKTEMIIIKADLKDTEKKKKMLQRTIAEYQAFINQGGKL